MWIMPSWRRLYAGDWTYGTQQRIGGISRLYWYPLLRPLQRLSLMPMTYLAPLPPQLQRGHGQEGDTPALCRVFPGQKRRSRGPRHTDQVPKESLYPPPLPPRLSCIPPSCQCRPVCPYVVARVRVYFSKSSMETDFSTGRAAATKSPSGDPSPPWMTWRELAAVGPSQDHL